MASIAVETSVRHRSLIVYLEPNSVDAASFGARAGAELEVLAGSSKRVVIEAATESTGWP
jgi:hypothetical protein